MMEHIDFGKLHEVASSLADYNSDEILFLKNQIDSSIEQKKAKFTLVFNDETEFDVILLNINTDINFDGVNSTITVCTTDPKNTLTIDLRKLKEVK